MAKRGVITLTPAEAAHLRAVHVAGMPSYMAPHKQCRECPFRVDSLRGYFGLYSPEHYLAAAMGEDRLQCHMTSTKPALLQRHCTGVALFRAKVCKYPRLPDQQRHQDACVERYGTDGILDLPGFQAHHMNGMFGLGLDTEEDE